MLYGDSAIYALAYSLPTTGTNLSCVARGARGFFGAI